MDSSLTARLSGLLSRPVRETDRERAALHVLDWIGCATIGCTTPPGEIIRDFGRDLPPGPCTAIGVGSVGANSAAFINGSYGNVVEMDDFHRTAFVHPGPVVIPAALACAQAAGASAADFLDSVVRGYEAAIRIGMSVGPGHYSRFYNTSTCGPFGAAAAAGSILGLDRKAMVHALGNAGTMAGGFWQMHLEGTMSKQFHTGRAADIGLASAGLAAKGLTGPVFILEGPQGFYATTCPDADPALVVAKPKAPWKLHDTSFKPWPACRYTHPAIGAALALRDGTAPEDVARITVRTYGDALRFCDQVEPKSPKEARFSLQHTVAVTLLDGPPTLASFDPETIERSDVANLRGRVLVETADPFASAYPDRCGAEVEICLRDGTTSRAVVPDALGDPANPLSDDAIERKARDLLMVAGLPVDRAEAVIAKVRALADGGRLEDVVPFCLERGPEVAGEEFQA